MHALAYSALSRRERQIMDILYRLGHATANEVIAEMPDPLHSSTVRTQLRVLEEKGHIVHKEEGLRYVYTPVTSRRTARRNALKHLMETFFDGSTEKVMAALLGGESALSDDELDRLSEMIEKARKGGR